eukprot:jgi/Picsp_1/434/NSC_00432-R1_proteasome assembly chaperone 2
MIQWHPVPNISNPTLLEDLKGKAILLPAIGPGNVGQLAMDILIESLGAERIGVLSHPFVLPSVGLYAYSHQEAGTLCHPLEVYRVRDSEYMLLQQRSPASAGCQEDFSKDLIHWLVQGAQVSRMWILGSLDASFRRDDEMQSVSQIRFIANRGNSRVDENETNDDDPSSVLLDQMVQACRQREPAATTVFGSLHEDVPDRGLQELDYRHWFESIGTRESYHMPWALINTAVECSDTPIVILCAFVLEGENSLEAFQLADVVLRVCELAQRQPDTPLVLNAPPSWAGSHVPPPYGYLLA